MVLPNIDICIGLLSKLSSQFPCKALAGWMLDERNAYRQLAVKPEHRHYSVIALMCPGSARPAFFLMVGHSFGPTAAVYNYNRKSCQINDFPVKLCSFLLFRFMTTSLGSSLRSLSRRLMRLSSQSTLGWALGMTSPSWPVVNQDLDEFDVHFQLSEMQVDVNADKNFLLIL
eukprot:6303684-Amphidinium_carterae.1